MDKLVIVCIVVTLTVIVLAATMLIYGRIKTRRIMRNLQGMLNTARNGNFKESEFNETILSAIESSFADYLSASVVSFQNLKAEKDKINQLITDISHQTKTPIANILLFSQLLEEQELPEKSRYFITSLSGQAEKLNFLIASLVKLSRLETGIFSLHPEKAELQTVLDELKSQFLPSAEKNGIFLSIETTDICAVFDVKWTIEALGNLVDNAIKYTSFGGRVSVKVTSYDMFCRIDVSDTGIGIPEEEHSKIFARFYRSPKLSSKEGVGIGLYLTRYLLTEQRGYIKVISELGKGSVFSAFLPKTK